MLLNEIEAPVLATSAPDWLSAAIIIVAITLAVATIVLMLVRPREAGSDVAAGGRRAIDPMLVVSAVVVVALAIAAWLLR